jgi:membrane-bound ClpP family serine protease
MCDCCNPKMWALKLFIAGIILILVRLYTGWDIWVVIGVLMIIKAIVMFFISHKCDGDFKAKKRK